ncbi:hypothetical protein N2152v2_000824 [Parachlorella kessleri]
MASSMRWRLLPTAQQGLSRPAFRRVQLKQRRVLQPVAASRSSAFDPFADALPEVNKLPPGTQQIQAAFKAVQTKLQRGDEEGAKKVLQSAIQIVGEDFGEKATLLGILHTQLYQLYFKEGHYQKALEQAQVAYDTTVRSFGKDTEEVQLYGLRLGMALLASGSPQAALPHLMSAGAMLERRAKEVQEALQQGVMRGLQPAEGDMRAMIHMLVASGEATFYAALCMLHLANSDAVGKPSQVQQMLLTGLENLALVLDPKDPVISTALREHWRLVEDSVTGGGDYELKKRLAEQHQLLMQKVYEAASEAKPFLP